jgi:glutaminyl-tRNA synthetase
MNFADLSFMAVPNPDAATAAPSDFIRDIVAQDVAEKRYPKIVTRFPPEPNGYLHIGHAKSICLNFGIALENGGCCNLRLDDTNPAKEEIEYVEAIVADVRWLISGWADQSLALKPSGEPFHASDYFGELYEFALTLIRKGRAYVCDLSPKETEEYRGAPDRPGKDSPCRNRSVEENLDWFQRMKAGEFPDGARTLRAKIDMASPNIWLRDPLLYRIRHTEHHQTGAEWRIYPMYDYAHCLSDYIEGITHSLCTVEFEVHRPLYDWVLASLDLPRALPHQYEFAKLKIGYTVMSKRKMLQFVQEKIVSGWDDPRMFTLSGFRRRGVPASALRKFAIGTGVTKFDSLTDPAVFEHVLREDLNLTALRRLAVLRPVKVVLTNIPPGEVIEFDAVNHPGDPAAGMRKVAFTRELFIDAEDFMEVPPPKYFRLKPGGEVRLKYACIITCQEVVKDAMGALVELRCTADLDSRTGGPNAAKKVKGTIHWVSATRCLQAEVRLYDRLFTVEDPEAGEDLKQFINPNSLEVVTAKLELSLGDARPEHRYQFERIGYFALDEKDSKPGKPIFNRTIALKDTWAKK